MTTTRTSDLDTAWRSELMDRRQRLQHALSHEVGEPSGELARLLHEVDGALSQLERGTFGLCDVCHGAINTQRLLANPLAHVCVECLTPDDQRALQQDLDLAQQIQSRLLPHRGDHVPGWDVGYAYRPMWTVSGDYVDLIPARGADGAPGTLVLFGDVSGKGVGASILMGSLHATFRTLAELGLPPAEMLQRTNRLFCESTPSASYVTLLCAFASASGRLDVFNAGHYPPLVRVGTDVTALPTGGVPLGMFDCAHYTAVSLQLDPGDAMLLHTDGISDATNGIGEPYGTDRLRRVFHECAQRSASDVVERCLGDLASFAHDGRIEDDVTMMVLQRRAAS